jgi:hypothetical protein
MSAWWKISLAALVVLGALYVDVFAAGDEAIFVPSRDVVATNFMRQLSVHRFDEARQLMSSARQEDVSAGQLRWFFEAIEARTGPPHHIEGEQPDLPGVRIEGPFGQARLVFAVVRENGLWRIDGLPQGEQIAFTKTTPSRGK